MSLINSAHDPGFACLAFSRDGSTLYTGGCDCLVRIWQADGGTDQEPSVAIEADQPVTCVAATEDGWLSGSADSEVRNYVKAKNELTGVLTTTPGVAIHSIAVDPQSRRVAVTSHELAVKLIDLDNTRKISLLEGHTRGVRRATWHPSGTLLTTCGSDGKIIVWDVSDEEPRIEKIIEGVIPAVADNESAEFQHDCSVLWHPSGQYFFVSTRSHEIATISRTTWTKSSTFTNDALSGAITALGLSPNGLYLASASKSGVFVWSTQTRRLLFKYGEKQVAPVAQIFFSPSQNLLAWTDGEGTLTRWPSPIPASSPGPIKIANDTTTIQAKRKPSPALFDDLDNGNAIGDDVNADIDMDDVGNEDWILDDIGGGMEDEPEAGRWNGKDGVVKEMVSVTKAQSAFQPGSTPIENKRRYLAYNMIGVIEVTDQDTHHIVNVEFHDRSTRTSYHFTDYYKYDMAALGERGALYACPPDAAHPAHVIYKPYGTWATQAEWTYELPMGVKALGIAAGGPPPRKSLRSQADPDIQGNGNVVIATTDNDLTFLNGGGVERFVMGLEGEFVSMVAGTEWVFVIYRDGSTTMDGSQNLRAILIEFQNFTVLQDKRLCIRKGHTLKWVGITDDGAPAIFDSAGVLHVLHHFRAPLRATWARMLDTTKLDRRQGKDESYWPVGVSGDMFMCLILKGRQAHPGWPRPLIQEVALRLPFRRTDPKEAPLEEHIARETLRLDIMRDALGNESTSDEISRRELDLDKEIIQLIQNACKNDKLPRVLELTKMLHHTPSFDMAVKVAGFYHLIGLQEKIEILKEDRDNGDEDFRENSRQQRKQWKQDSAAVPPPRLAGESSSSVYHAAKPFQDFGPPPAIHRPGLARAAGVGQPKAVTTPYEHLSDRNNSGLVDDGEGPADSGFDGKRKRDEQEQLIRDQMSPGLENGSKRRALATSVPPKPKPNPFAKKPEAENCRNPFARNADKSLHKSETFFDKVEAAETGAYGSKRTSTKGQAKEKKSVTRQTTLFGMPAVPPPDKDKGRKKKLASGKELQANANETGFETQEGQETESQSTDVTIVDAGTSQTLVETHTEEETQLEYDNQDSNKEADEEEAGEIEWPPSPQQIPVDEEVMALDEV